MSTTDTPRAAGAATADVATPGPDLARSQGTGFFSMDDLLTAEERAITGHSAFA